MIPHRNLDAVEDLDPFLTEKNKGILRDMIDRDLGFLFYSSLWRDEINPSAVEYMTEYLAGELDVRASECRSAVNIMARDIMKEATAEGEACVRIFEESFPWNIVEKCLKDEEFEGTSMQGPRNKIASWLPQSIDDPFLKKELPIVVMSAMDVISAYERNGPKRKANPIDRDKLIEYLLIEFKIDSGHFRFTHYPAMKVIVPQLVDRLVPLMVRCKVSRTELA